MLIVPRVIPCLLLGEEGLVKTERFKRPVYVGDPINVARLFNDKQVDELVLLDICATPRNRGPRFADIAAIASECFMPVAYGGGVSSIQDMEKLFQCGVEKVLINSRAIEDPGLVRSAADHFGSQSVVVSLDVGRDWLGRGRIRTRGGRTRTGLDPVEQAVLMERSGAGELLLTSIDRDGTMKGYDLELIRSVTASVGIPVVACGGAGCLADMAAAVKQAGASAAAAGSIFVFHGPHRAVLVNYPSPAEIQRELERREGI